MLLLAEGEAVAPAPGVLVAVSPEALGLVPVVLAVPAFALCEAAALPLISGVLLAAALACGVWALALLSGVTGAVLFAVELVALGVEEALWEDMPFIEPAAAPVPAAAAALGLLVPELVQLGEMELTLETWIEPLPLSIPEIETVWPIFWLNCEFELLSPCRVQLLPLLSVRL